LDRSNIVTLIILRLKYLIGTDNCNQFRKRLLFLSESADASVKAQYGLAYEINLKREADIFTLASYLRLLGDGRVVSSVAEPGDKLLFFRGTRL